MSKDNERPEKVNFRVKIKEEILAQYSADDLRVLGAIVGHLQKEGGWKWKHYNIELASTYERVFEADGVQPEVKDIFMSMAHGHDLETIISKVTSSLMKGLFDQ